MSTEEKRGNMMGRVLAAVRHLLRGQPLDRRRAAKLLPMTDKAADRFLRDLRRLWPELIEDRLDGRRTLRWSRTGHLPDSVAVAACFGASLSRLFEGSNYESGLRVARQRIVDNVRRPERFANFDRKFHFVRRGGELMLPDNASLLDELVDAVLRQNPVNMTYRRFAGGRERLRIRPLSLVVYDHQLYVIGRDEQNEDHPYRFSRIVDVEGDSDTFEYPSKTDYDPDRLFRDSFGIFVGREFKTADVVVKLNAAWAPFVACHRWHREQVVSRRGGDVIIRMRVRLCPELKAWILGFGAEAEVLEPAELRADIAARAHDLARLYAT